MVNIKWYNRIIVALILTLIAFILCLFFESDLWVMVGLGAFTHQIFEYIFMHIKFRRT